MSAENIGMDSYRRGWYDGASAMLVVGASIALICLLAGCATVGGTQTVAVTWVKYKTVEDARVACSRILKDEFAGKAIACAQWYPGQNKCTVHVVDITLNVNSGLFPRGVEAYHDRVLGHDVRHCFDGDFHKGRPH